MTIYQQELLRKLSEYKCTGQYNEESKRLEVSYGGIPLCSQNEDGFLRYHGDKTVTDDWKAALKNTKEQAAKIREYVRMYETAPPMEIPDVSEYRRMAEYGDTVLAGMYSEQHGFMFTTWRQSADKSSVAHGDYSPNFDKPSSRAPACRIKTSCSPRMKRRTCIAASHMHRITAKA